MIVSRVERHIIHNNHELYNKLDEYCFKSKNLYNKANYVLRHLFFENKKIYSYSQMDKEFKQWEEYKNMMSQVSQQTLKLLEKNWKSYFDAIKEYKKKLEEFTGKPKIPKYKDKNGRYIVKFTNQNCKLKNNNYIQFPKIFNKYLLKTKINGKLKEVRIIPKNKEYIIEVVYDLEVIDKKYNNDRYMGIDIGVDNLVAISSNVIKPILINGKGLKSINQFYNKQISYYKSINDKLNHILYTKRLYRITNKRNHKVEDYLHKASRKIVNIANENNINTIIIGKNKDWKRGVNIGTVNNQNFVFIPFEKLIQMIQYKAENIGISVIITEESYTSGTSYLDNELPMKEQYNKNRRKKRGLFESNNGKLINADINASFQIIKKVVPDVFNQGIEGLVLNPIKINIF